MTRQCARFTAYSVQEDEISSSTNDGDVFEEMRKYRRGCPKRSKYRRVSRVLPSPYVSGTEGVSSTNSVPEVIDEIVVS